MVQISCGLRFSWTMLSMMPGPLLYRNPEQVSPKPGMSWSRAWERKLKVVVSRLLDPGAGYLANLIEKIQNFLFSGLGRDEFVLNYLVIYQLIVLYCKL